MIGQVAQDLENVLNVKLTIENMGVDKPDKKIFEHALKKFGAKASEALMVGDLENDDVLGANRCKIKSVLFKTKKNQKSKANFVISEIPEVLNILNNLDK